MKGCWKNGANVRADPFTRWQELVRSARSGRFRAERDLAFWQQRAAAYDDNQPPLPNTVAWLRGELSGLSSLLEVGAGTGRLLLPLADAVAQATALDYSSEMLAQLQAKGPPPHLRLVCASIAEAPAHVPRHDAVLAAWSLAYQADLKGALETLRGLSEHALYLLEDDGIGSPHVTLRRELAGQPKPQRATLLREAVEALGWPAQTYVITETREVTLPSTAALLDFVRLPLEQGEVISALAPHLTAKGAGWRYRWPFAVQALRVKVEG